MYILIWQSVMWRPGTGWVPHWREEACSLPGRPRRPDGAILTDRTVTSHPDCRSTSILIAAQQVIGATPALVQAQVLDLLDPQPL
jgi:hypothetical protein